ncbi:hypothetical protein CWO07_20445 [Vibrio splendidus]|uniref:Uncharacterized protein n=1 Tax=Vibrio splendidus TaxID=29497 RepID=A0A2T5EQZ0_VIBSP|nr:hypothetical protein [Vibrio splendidus]PMI90300.1 hypothetical protein BCU63_14085 [Vibrio splendidus]PMJ63066.1 hypothetical protein BCU23_02675 [Vibrio splendidus]PTP26939.1 hypothetical protein CWO07_20445 [Vibrio splendidus]
MLSSRMDKSQYELFNVLNDTILLRFDRLTPWKKNFITELHHKVVTRQLISIKQKQLALKISMKAYKSKKKNARSNV